jgi:hypothetical protein
MDVNTIQLLALTTLVVPMIPAHRPQDVSTQL